MVDADDRNDFSSTLWYYSEQCWQSSVSQRTGDAAFAVRQDETALKYPVYVPECGRNRRKRAIHGAFRLALPSMAGHCWKSQGYLRAAKSCYKANAASPVLWLTAVLAGLFDKWLLFPKSS